MHADASRLCRKVLAALATIGGILGCVVLNGCGAEDEEIISPKEVISPKDVISPGDIRNIVLYSFNDRPGHEPKPSQLWLHVDLGQARTQRMLQGAQYRETSPAWKIPYYCVASTWSGAERCVWLSIAPSGWFTIEGQKGYYRVEGSGWDEIEKVLTACNERTWESADDWAERVRGADGPIPMKSGALYGYARQDGEWAVPPQFDDALPFSEGLAAVRVGDADTGLWGYIDAAGTLVIKPNYAGAFFFSEGLAVVTVDDYFEGKQGYIDRSGRMVIEPKFDLAREFRGGVAEVVCNGNYYMGLDHHGTILNREVTFDTKEGMTLIGVNGMHYGFRDATGLLVVPPVFDEARPFSEGLAAVKRNGKWGYINKTGEVVIECRFDRPGSFSGGEAEVVLGSNAVTIGKDGVPVPRNWLRSLLGY